MRSFSTWNSVQLPQLPQRLLCIRWRWPSRVQYFRRCCFVSTTVTKISMKCVVNWIPLRIRVRSRNAQPHLWPIKSEEEDPPRVPGLPIRDCARGCNNRTHTRLQLSAIDVTEKTFFERLYLVPGMGTFGPWVNCPYAPTTLILHSTTISGFLCNFFPRMAPHFFGQHDSPSNLAESRWGYWDSLLGTVQISPTIWCRRVQRWAQ